MSKFTTEFMKLPDTIYLLERMDVYKSQPRRWEHFFERYVYPHMGSDILSFEEEMEVNIYYTTYPMSSETLRSKLQELLGERDITNWDFNDDPVRVPAEDFDSFRVVLYANSGTGILLVLDK